MYAEVKTTSYKQDPKAKTSFLSFCQKKCVLTIFRFFEPLKALLIFFFYQMSFFFFFKQTFLVLKLRKMPGVLLILFSWCSPNLT
jgi:hypothetical protein